MGRSSLVRGFVEAQKLKCRDISGPGRLHEQVRPFMVPLKSAEIRVLYGFFTGFRVV